MVKKTLTLTIVIPVFNEQDQIDKCLAAIAAQTDKPDQVIVVDNNSSDCTQQAVKKYPSVKLLTEHRQGIVYGRNKGFNRVRSDLIGRIDADTNLPANWVESVKKIYDDAGRPKYYAATAPSEFRNRGFKSWWLLVHRLTYFWPSRLLIGHNTLIGSNMFMTRPAWQLVKNEVCLRTDIHEDMDLAFHLGKKGVAVGFHPSLKSSVVARKMLSRSISYPTMMAKLKLVSH